MIEYIGTPTCSKVEHIKDGPSSSTEAPEDPSLAVAPLKDSSAPLVGQNNGASSQQSKDERKGNIVDTFPIYPTVAAAMGLQDAFKHTNAVNGSASVSDEKQDCQSSEEEEEADMMTDIPLDDNDTPKEDKDISNRDGSATIGESVMTQDTEETTEQEENLLQKLSYACCGIGA